MRVKPRFFVCAILAACVGLFTGCWAGTAMNFILPDQDRTYSLPVRYFVGGEEVGFWNPTNKSNIKENEEVVTKKLMECTAGIYDGLRVEDVLPKGKATAYKTLSSGQKLYAFLYYSYHGRIPDFISSSGGREVTEVWENTLFNVYVDENGRVSACIWKRFFEHQDVTSY